MKMSEKTLLKKIEQAFAENYCNGTYKLELDHNYDDCTYYVLYYTYETGETISVDITDTYLGEVKFYSPVHGYYISNFNNHIKSVINVLRMLFDMIDSNKEVMINYYAIKTEEPEETEETTEENSKDVMEVKQELNARFGKELYFDTDSLQPNKTIIENINHCPNQNTCCIVSSVVHCNYNYKSDSCIKAHKNFIHYCEQVHKQMKARSNSKWHHVRLAKLANIDIGMLDEKRQRYLKIYKELIKTVNDLHKCKTAATYESRWMRFRQVIADDINYRGTTLYMTRFLDAKISMCNVECGLWSSADEKATSFIKSRRYRQTTLK